MRIKFLCPHCERVCRVPAELAGKQGRCPGCQKGLEVPTESTYQSMQLEQAAEARRRGESGQGRTSERMSERASGAGVVSEEPTDTATGELPELRPCKTCGQKIPADVETCIHCGAATDTAPIPLQIKIALAFFLCLPLPGLALAQWGLMVARKREKHVKLAWVAVGLNAANLVFNLVYFLVKGFKS